MTSSTPQTVSCFSLRREKHETPGVSASKKLFQDVKQNETLGANNTAAPTLLGSLPETLRETPDGAQAKIGVSEGETRAFRSTTGPHGHTRRAATPAIDGSRLLTSVKSVLPLVGVSSPSPRRRAGPPLLPPGRSGAVLSEAPPLAARHLSTAADDAPQGTPSPPDAAHEGGKE